jgi:glycosyltransferase involved in cell wall biosynthesis
MTMAFNTFVAMGNQQKIVVIVSNDLSTDQRVRKMCSSLLSMGYEITLLGRLLPNSLPIERPYEVKRFRLLFKKGALFYANLNIRLFFYLLFASYDSIHANDLDTLLPAYLVSRWRKKPLVYDTHEIFTEVPEIEGRWVKKVWQKIESFIFPKLEMIITVNNSIAAFYGERYGKEIRVIRNIPEKRKTLAIKSRAELSLPENKYIIISQGSGINIDRGNEELLLSMQFLEDDVLLLFVGSGDAIPTLKKISEEHHLGSKVNFIDRMPYEEMIQYTANANLGISLDKASNLNYLYSLPNKIFDYISVNTPILASNLPEVAAIVNEYRVGMTIDKIDPESIAKAIKEMRLLNKNHWNEQLTIAKESLTWEIEALSLKDFY